MTNKFIKHDKIIVRIRDLIRQCIHLFGWHSSRDCEYSFAKRHISGKSMKILDIGSCESLLPYTLAKKGFEVTVFDFRKYFESHFNLRSVEGDFIKNNLPSNYFDYIIMISTIEHIGFGSYGAPIYNDGDFQAMTQAKRLLKSNGKIILTFPFAGKHRVLESFERWYDIHRVKKLFAGFNIIAEEYYRPNKNILGRWVDFVPANLEQIKQAEKLYNCSGVACYLISHSKTI